MSDMEDESIEGSLRASLITHGIEPEPRIEKPVVPIPTEPGLYPGLDYDTYAAIPAVNYSFLADMDRESPLHAQYIKAVKGGREDTESMMMGRAVHLALLEPEKFDSEVLPIPDVDRRTKAGKQAWAEFQKEAAGRIVLPPGQMGRVREIAHAIQRHESARELFLNKGVNEMTMVWDDRATGVRIKGRVDRWTTFMRQPCLMDLKTTRDVNERKFQRSLVDFRYNLQATLYLMGAETLRPIPDGSGLQRVFFWLAVEADGPFDIGVFQADTKIIEHGVQKIRQLLRIYKECRTTGVWPGKNGQGVVLMDNPEFVYKADPIDGMLEEI